MTERDKRFRGDECDRTERIFNRILLYAFLIIVALYFIIPFFVMFVTSIKSMDEIRTSHLLALPKKITFEAWVKAWSTANIGAGSSGMQRYFLNSIVMVIFSVAISTIIGAINGYILSKWRFKGSEVFFSLLMLGCFIPFQIILLPMSRTLGILGMGQSIQGLIFVHVVYGIPFTTLFFRNFYAAFPNELIEAAKVDGAGFFKIWWEIVLPLSGPIFAVTVIWQFTQIWNDFLFGVCFSGSESQPVTVALNNLVNTSTGVKEYNVDMAAALIAGLPTLVVYFLSGKYFVKGLTAGALAST